MLTIYRSAAWTMLRNLPTYLICAAGFIAVDEVGNRGAQVGMLLGFGLTIPYFLHRSMLIDATIPLWGWHNFKVGQFRSYGVTLLLLGLAVASSVGVAWALNPGPLAMLDPEQLQAAQRGTLVASYLVYALILALLGTALPAASVGERGVLLGALRRSHRVAPRILLGLLAGPGLVLALGAWLLPRITAPIEAAWRPIWDGRRLDPGAASLALTVELLGLFVTTLVVAVLCHAYRRDAPPMSPPPRTDAVSARAQA